MCVMQLSLSDQEVDRECTTAHPVVIDLDVESGTLSQTNPGSVNSLQLANGSQPNVRVQVQGISYFVLRAFARKPPQPSVPGNPLHQNSSAQKSLSRSEVRMRFASGFKTR